MMNNIINVVPKKVSLLALSMLRTTIYISKENVKDTHVKNMFNMTMTFSFSGQLVVYHAVHHHSIDKEDDMSY